MTKIPFRLYHLLQILSSWEPKSPLDEHIKNYFQTHKALGSKDGKEISDTLYQLIRWQSTIDYFIDTPVTWERRLETAKSLDERLKDKTLPPHIRLGFPKELFDLLYDSLNEKTESFCNTSNSEAPVTVRINSEKISVEAFQARFPQAKKCVFAPFGFTFPKREPFTSWSEFKEGLFEMQDEASQLVAELVDAKPNDLVLDYCAGSGGKALSFAYKLKKQGKIFLHDIRKNALLEAEKRAMKASVHLFEILQNKTQHMDWILIDAPCSGTGTLRRHVEQKFLVTKELVKKFIELQREIFDEALPLLKPKGKIVYATCSVLREENDEQIDYFLKKYPLTLCAHPFRSLPEVGGMDGFFGSVLQFNPKSSTMTP